MSFISSLFIHSVIIQFYSSTLHSSTLSLRVYVVFVLLGHDGGHPGHRGGQERGRTPVDHHPGGHRGPTAAVLAHPTHVEGK